MLTTLSPGRDTATQVRPDSLVSGTLDRILKHAARIAGADHIELLLVDRPAGILRVAAVRGAPIPDDFKVPLATSYAGTVVETARPLFVANTQDDPDNPLAARDRASGRMTYLGLPIKTGAAVLGVLSITTTSPRTYSEREIDLLGSFAEQAAIVLENARLYDESERRRKTAEALAGLARMLTEHRDLADLGQRIVEAAVPLFSATFADLRLADADGGLRVLAATGAGAPFPVGIGATHAVADGRAVLCADVLDDPRMLIDNESRGMIERSGERAVLAVPLRAEGRIIGALTIGDRAGRTFSEAEAALLQAFGDQAAIALENARLHTETQQQLRYTQTLLAVAQAVGSNLELSETMRRVAREMAHALGADMVGAYILADDVLRPLAGYHVPKHLRESFIEFPIPLKGHGLVEEAWRLQRPVCSPDAIADLRVDRETVRRFPFRSLVVAPMLVKGEPLGALFAVWWNTAAEAREAELRLAEGISRQAALAIEDAALYHETEERRREAEILAELTRTINASLEFDTVLQAVVAGAKDLCRADQASIALWDPERQAAIARYWAADADPGYAGLGIEPGKGAGGLVLDTGKPFRTNDYAADPRISKDYLDIALANGVVALMAVPIRADHRVEGLIYVEQRSPRLFSDRDEQNLVRLAETAATAINNARLYARQQTARAETQATAWALRATEEEYRALVENSIQGIYVHRHFVIVLANQAMARILGVEQSEDLIGQDMRTFLAAHEVARIEAYDRARAEGNPAPPRTELQFRRRDGTLVWIEIVASPFPLHGTTATLIAAQDVSDRKRAEDALRVSEQQLRQAQKMEAVGRLAGGVANDFNNLLTVISGRSQLLQKALAGDDRLRRHADLIEKTASRASRLTQQLLAFSRQQVLQPTVLDLNTVVGDVATALRRTFDNIELVIAPAPELGHVRADRGQIEQVVLNLAANARDAMPTGGRLIIETANFALDEAVTSGYPGLDPGAYVMLAVSDTGCGMSPETQARMFEPFFTTKGADKGSGLGLSTVYGVVKQSGGEVLVYSELGHGTTVKIYLPRVRADAESSAADRRDGDERGAETILLVEDEAGVRELAHEILADCGYCVIDAQDPDEALLIGEHHEGQIDLLVTDLMMARMSGRELAQRLAPLRPAMKVLYMSGYTDAAVVHQGGLDPTMAFLAKPFGTAALTAKVRELLDTPAS